MCYGLLISKYVPGIVEGSSIVILMIVVKFLHPYFTNEYMEHGSENDDIEFTDDCTHILVFLSWSK